MSEHQEKVATFIELHSPEEKLRQVCAQTQRHYEQGQTVSIYAPDQTEAAELDSILWTLRQNSFIPHVRLEETDEPLLEPVLIFSSEPGDITSDVLILASADEQPPWFARFHHICDFAAVYDEELRQASRRRYTACKEAGYRMRFLRG
jgi:DNA polymerase-3 subunit chi